MKKVTRLRRAVAVALVLLFILPALSACQQLVPEEDDTLSIYATFYPIYALTEAVMRNVPNAALHCLVQPQDGCLRAYALSDWDIAILRSGADAVIAGGRGLESFEDTLFGWGEDGPAISAVLYNLELCNQQQQADSEAQSHLAGPNPHLYMSVDGAKEIVQSISAMMVSLDPMYADTYAANTEIALSELDALRDELRGSLAAYAGRRVALMSEALIYVARDYDLTVAEWIDRETGASFGDNELAAWLEALSAAEVDVILIERQAPQALKQALEAAGYAVAPIDVLSTHREGEGFERYIEIMRGNAQAVRDAFERVDTGRERH